MKIHTRYDPKPGYVDTRTATWASSPWPFDWEAVTEDYTGEGGEPIGFGSTEEEAITDLKEQMYERTIHPDR